MVDKFVSSASSLFAEQGLIFEAPVVWLITINPNTTNVNFQVLRLF